VTAKKSFELSKRWMLLSGQRFFREAMETEEIRLFFLKY
jgi:hypothetical protein